MVYLEKEKEHTFLAQTMMKTEKENFSLHTASSNEVTARFDVTSGDQRTENRFNRKNAKNNDQILITSEKFGHVQIKNRKSEEVNVHLELNLDGNMDNRSFKDKSVKITQKPGYNGLNPENNIIWEMTLAANQTFNIDFAYDYKFYQRY